MSIEGGAGESLSRLEVAGAASARLAHALSNHLSIITGNLSVAAALKDHPEKAATAMGSALKAANEAGAFVGRFVDARRAIQFETEQTPVAEAMRLLEEWKKARTEWQVEWDMAGTGPNDLALTMPENWMRFVLEEICSTKRVPAGTISCRRMERNARGFNPILMELKPVGFAQIVVASADAQVIDWNEVRTNLSDFRLTAVYELLSLCGATVESRLNGNGTVLTEVNIPLVKVG